MGFSDVIEYLVLDFVALTFDDGMRSVLTEASPILKDYAAPAHIFITSDLMDSPELWPPAGQVDGVPGFEMLNWDEVGELQNARFSIDAHTRTHPDMRRLEKTQIIEECAHCNERIERYTGRRPEFFAYPFGYHNLRVRECVNDIYKASVTTELSYLNSAKEYVALPRLDSYYLQSPWILNSLQKMSTRAYMRFRWLMRTLRGSHCTAGYDD